MIFFHTQHAISIIYSIVSSLYCDNPGMLEELSIRLSVRKQWKRGTIIKTYFFCARDCV